MILNLSVEVSDEVIELFGYSFYERNQKKSAEAEEVFKRLFSNLQSELKKEYKNTAQGLKALDERLKILEMYSADAQEVDRAINNLNNRVTRIDSALNEYERQQKNIAKQMEQTETFVNQFYVAINEDINKFQKDFATKLKTEVDSQVERLLKRILANNLHDIAKVAVDAVVKDYDFPAPDYSAIIQNEVAKAVRNIPAPDYSAIIQNEVTRAVRNIPAPDYSATIKAETASTIRNIFTQNFNTAIQNIVAKAVNLELQKTQASKATVSNYVYQEKIDKQREIIDAQQKSIEELQEMVKALTARFSAIEKKSPAMVEPKAEIPLSIRDENSWQEYKNRLLDIGKLEQFAQNNSANFYSLTSKLNRIKKAIDKINPQEFNEYTTEIIVNKTVDIAKEFMDSLENCNRTINNPRKNSSAAKKLSSLIKEYLAGLGIRPMDFKIGGNYEEWADLGMSETPMIESTDDMKKHNTLKEIYVQPHFIDYLDEHDKEIRRVFGGRCVAYAYKN